MPTFNVYLNKQLIFMGDKLLSISYSNFIFISNFTFYINFHKIVLIFMINKKFFTFSHNIISSWGKKRITTEKKIVEQEKISPKSVFAFTFFFLHSTLGKLNHIIFGRTQLWTMKDKTAKNWIIYRKKNPLFTAA